MQLKIQKRELTGKKINKYRKEWFVPGVTYGKHLKNPKKVLFNKWDFLRLYKKVWETTPFNLTSKGYSEMVMIHDIQLHPVTSQVLHVDFLAVKADETTEVEVPVVLVWEAPIEKTGEWKIEVVKDYILVEALPNDIPDKIELDISNIATMNDVLFVKDIELWEKVTIKDDFEQPLITVSHFSEEPPEEEEELVEDSEEGQEEWESEETEQS